MPVLAAIVLILAATPTAAGETWLRPGHSELPVASERATDADLARRVAAETNAVPTRFDAMAERFGFTHGRAELFSVQGDRTSVSGAIDDKGVELRLQW